MIVPDGWSDGERCNGLVRAPGSALRASIVWRVPTSPSICLGGITSNQPAWVTCFGVQYFVSAEISARGRAAEHL